MRSHQLRVAVSATLLFIVVAAPAWAWHVGGQVFCDDNGSRVIDAGDAALDGAGVLITALTVSPGTTFAATTDSGDGSFSVALPDHAEDYRVELTGSGLPPGAVVIVPASGAYGAPPVPPVHLEPGAYDVIVSFLVDRCVAAPSPSPTPAAATATPTATPTPVSSPLEIPSATATPVASPTPWLSDFQCYEVGASTIGPILGVALADRFGAATVDLDDIRRVRRFCAPTRLAAEDAQPDVGDRLVGYVVTQRTPRFAPIVAETVTNRFGTIVVRLVRPVLLLVPSAASLDGPPSPVAPAPDHFQCYRVKGAKARQNAVPVVDEFGAKLFDVKRPSWLCTAVDKENEGVLDPDANLLCYTVRPTKNTPVFRGPPGPVLVANQFGPDTLKVTHGRELCVPSTVSP